jgi:predicted Fe-S protein YdhL (DUF1289 family)
MSDLIECLHCHDHFAPEGMHICQHSKAQLCIGCSTRIRAENRAKGKVAAKARIAEFQAIQREEREAKNKMFEAVLSIKAPRKLSKCRMIDVDRVLADIRSKNVIDSFS